MLYKILQKYNLFDQSIYIYYIYIYIFMGHFQFIPLVVPAFMIFYVLHL
jgi:hypothetical protein